MVAWKIYFYEAINKPPTSFANYHLEVPSRKNVFGVCRSVDHTLSMKHDIYILEERSTLKFESNSKLNFVNFDSHDFYSST